MRSTQSEDFDWSNIVNVKRRSDSVGFIRLGEIWKTILIQCPKEWNRAVTGFYFLNRRQGVRLRIKAKFLAKPDTAEKHRAYNFRPDVEERRKKAFTDRYHSDPEFRRSHIDSRIEYFKANKERQYERKRARKPITLESDRAYIREWQRKRRETDPQYRIGNRLRSRLWHAVEQQGGKKSAKTESLTGCSVAQLRAHLESLFVSGMTWKNIGKWHLDHVVPCAQFDLTQEDQQRRCFHYSNLQPMWKRDNLSKSDKVVPCQPELLISLRD